jgi:hypothetical protein
VVGAPDRAFANAATLRWIDDLGPVGDCKSSAKLEEKDLQLQPGVHWIGDEERFGKARSERLQAIYRNRPRAATQFYVSLKPMVSNPSFDHDALPHIKLPDADYQFLGLYRVHDTHANLWSGCSL